MIGWFLYGVAVVVLYMLMDRLTRKTQSKIRDREEWER